MVTALGLYYFFFGSGMGGKQSMYVEHRKYRLGGGGAVCAVFLNLSQILFMLPIPFLLSFLFFS
jgi:hypothetical protein